MYKGCMRQIKLCDEESKEKPSDVSAAGKLKTLLQGAM